MDTNHFTLTGCQPVNLENVTSFYLDNDPVFGCGIKFELVGGGATVWSLDRMLANNVYRQLKKYYVANIKGAIWSRRRFK